MIPRWDDACAGEAVAALAGVAGLVDEVTPSRNHGRVRHDEVARTISVAAGLVGIEAEPVETPYDAVDRLVAGAAPAVWRLRDGGVIAIVARRGGRLTLLAADRDLVEVSAAEVAAAIRGPIDSRHAGEVDTMLDRVGLAGARRDAARTKLLAGRLGNAGTGSLWILRAAPGAPARTLVRGAGLGGRLAALIGAKIAETAAWTGSWWLLGRGALGGAVDLGWLLGWALLVASMLPLRLLVSHLVGTLAIDGGALLEIRMLAGTVELAPDELRDQGVGAHLGRVIEANAVEHLALSGGIAGMLSAVELVVAVAVLAAGAGGALQATTLIVVLAGIAMLVPRYLRYARRWTDARISLTEATTERMVGHRTRAIQERSADRHTIEDHACAGYLHRAVEMDRSALVLDLVPQVWLIVGLAALVPAVIAGDGNDAGLAVAVGGLLLAHAALARLVAGARQLIGAAIAWQRIGPVVAAAARAEAPSRYEPVRALEAGSIELRGVDYAHPGRRRLALRDIDLRIEPGERILLEGASGTGKSTLATVLAGLAEPTAGLALLGGFDRKTLGTPGWRRRVVLVPQFHDNHVFMGPLAFNLLMGRSWPPTDADLAEAEAVCRELGLGPLLDTMPGGVLQVVGETGWQLSHGERSRLFIARALLQDPALMILDESFAALDPETLERSLHAVLTRARALVVIAHP